MAKKARSAKQKANDARLGRMAKARARKTPTKSRKTTKTRKVNKPRKTPRKTMAKKRSAPKKKGILANIPFINNPTVRKAAQGVGTATLGAAVLTLIAPQLANNQIVRPVLALAGGGVPGVVAQVLSQGGLQAIGLGGNRDGVSFTPGFG